MLKVVLLCFLSFLTFEINGQLYNTNTATRQQDTSSIQPPTVNSNGFFSLFKGKPGRAALYSLLIPGGGQVYNKKWWKVPLAIGIDVSLLYILIDNNKNYKNAQSIYLEALTQKPQPSNLSRLKSSRDYFRKWKEYAWLWLFLGKVATAADAYVDRHLMTFNINDDISLHPFLDNYNPVFTKIGVNFNLNYKKESDKNLVSFDQNFSLP
jgi:Family of unknown function (DUF5683)